MTSPQFDVFLSYHSDDRELATQIASELRDSGLRVWFDQWELRPGWTWVERLDDAIKDSNAAVVLIGPSGVGPWEAAEVRGALQRYVSRGSPVIPVILPGVKEPVVLPSFLEQHTWVDCRSKSSHERLDALVWGITGRKLTRSISQIGQEYFLTIQRPHQPDRVSKIYTLTNPDNGNLLYLTWETFGKGIENLATQIRNCGHHLNLDACIGINDAGLVMATFLNSYVLHYVRLGYVRCKGGAEATAISDQSFFPLLPDRPTVMIVDFEIKEGNVFRSTCNEIRRRYPGARLYFSVFGAMTKGGLHLKTLDELESAEKLRTANLEDIFIACTMHRPGIEPPLGLR